MRRNGHNYNLLQYSIMSVGIVAVLSCVLNAKGEIEDSCEDNLRFRNFLVPKTNHCYSCGPKVKLLPSKKDHSERSF